jgi:hypothetical protein
MLGFDPLLNRSSGLSIKIGVLLFKQPTRPVTDNASPILRCAAHTHTQKQQVLHSKCLRFATNEPWHEVTKIHNDSGIPFFADHIRN